MTTPRDYGAELDEMRDQLNKLQQLMEDFMPVKEQSGRIIKQHLQQEQAQHSDKEQGRVYYSGQFQSGQSHYRWEPQEREADQLLELDGDKAAKILAALGHKQRLDILRTVLQEPLTGPELVERLNMGTTGQLYHHMKALAGADLLVQEERGGKYAIPGHRVLPLLLLLAATSDFMDTSDYLDMYEVRNDARSYLGDSPDASASFDPHYLLWAVVENSLLEHLHGTCTEVRLFLHRNGSVTVADNGRGIPVQALPDQQPRVQAVLTDMSRLSASASFLAPGGEKGISMPIVNALSRSLTVEIRRDGKVFEQHYKHGIPQSELQTVGITKETGTRLTFQPDRDIFDKSFELPVLQKQAAELSALYPKLKLQVLVD
ncbi:ATP-binding protein [Paenibacillus aceris]|uniref:DNA topoisomerase (ATP-hydrolyzing) n=1 Tax=Paenibacillus aceris TaxID=869555 RepID=A0ABS4I0L6_9BACL|nr:ATP-binding protein [Paenibacillus aceris]MBP1963966.1 DNA gyrase subunit B [Paenibacillus aceris]NHW34615.1 helix-turn-helix domain-containing protein [Paenibacillus aceris]